MAQLTSGQLKYILRETFNASLPIFSSGVCKCREQLEQIVLCLRTTFLSEDPVFWFRPVENSCDGETAYFVGLKNIHIVEYPSCLPDYENRSLIGWDSKPRVREEDEKSVLNTLMEEGRQFERDRAYIRGLMPLAHQEVKTTMSEFLKYARSNTDIWDARFPGITMDFTATSEQIMYGRRLVTSASDVLNQFVQMLGGKELPKEIRTDIDRRIE